MTFADLDGNSVVDETEILQTNHYYPFGMRHEPSSMVTQTENAYQYNGKELNTDFGLDWLDYGARWYDASIARWSAVDPLAEKYQAFTSYGYVRNNPIILLDPNGMNDVTSMVQKAWDATSDKGSSITTYKSLTTVSVRKEKNHSIVTLNHTRETTFNKYDVDGEHISTTSTVKSHITNNKVGVYGKETDIERGFIAVVTSSTTTLADGSATNTETMEVWSRGKAIKDPMKRLEERTTFIANYAKENEKHWVDNYVNGVSGVLNAALLNGLAPIGFAGIGGNAISAIISDPIKAGQISSILTQAGFVTTGANAIKRLGSTREMVKRSGVFSLFKFQKMVFLNMIL